ncbi:hypothetical protein [Paenibacillus cremeus]|uniref:Copper amine oxidase-like N-terminal domain-containing protein n=1 Tax=Paenibacillus cremeus TaxID=2163881 RepID=A0A559K012_9BACL|nr:hypothetical protein [Paenibacillus cremeus]TVY05436.1 hypothetical protein FPZ49_30415 [Paenibacillus cremeus]
MKKIATGCLLLLILLLAVPVPTKAESATVKVTIPDYPVSVNGQLIDSRHSQYPLLVYKDITYVPLSWNMLQELELEADWSAEEGLKVYRNCCVYEYWKTPALEKQPYPQPHTTTNLPQHAYMASKASYPIQLWGEQINNEQEPYPFLEFRDVTYMPLTWRFAHTRLMMDLEMSEDAGLSIWSGQDKVMGQIIDDDENSLYVSAYRSTDNAHTLLKIAKTLAEPPVWLDADQAKAVRDRVDQARTPQGQKVTIEQKDDWFMYQGQKLAPLRDEDKQNLGGNPLKAEGTLYEIDGRRQLLAVYSYYPIAVIGPAPGSRYQLFSIMDGKITFIDDYPYLPQRIWSNPDGSVWIARERMYSRKFYFPGSGLLALMNTSGKVMSANQAWGELDVTPLDLVSAGASPNRQDGSVLVRLYGQSKADGEYNADRDGIFRTNASLKLERLSNAPDELDDLPMYVDRQGDVYSVNHYSNTIKKWTQSQPLTKTWTDVELLQGR